MFWGEKIYDVVWRAYVCWIRSATPYKSVCMEVASSNIKHPIETFFQQPS